VYPLRAQGKTGCQNRHGLTYRYGVAPLFICAKVEFSVRWQDDDPCQGSYQPPLRKQHAMVTSKKLSGKKTVPAAQKIGAASDYPALLAEVKARIQSAQYTALRAVNKELVGLYWDIGRLIVERQQREGWGKGVVEQLSADLQSAFPGIGGFSASNLWRMKGFFEAYRDATKLAPLVREIGWAHNLRILERCTDMQEREFYLRITRKFGWSKNILAYQIDNQSYEKFLLGQTNFAQTLTPELQAQAKLAVKDEYIFDFLELGEQYGERELERALIARIEDFLRAMGGMFAFMGSQYRLEVDDEEYFIDLLLFHRRLRALVAVELKVGAFRCVRTMKTRPSASSCARKKSAPLWNMLCATRANLLAWRPGKSPRRCPRNSKTSCPHPNLLPDCWTGCTGALMRSKIKSSIPNAT